MGQSGIRLQRLGLQAKTAEQDVDPPLSELRDLLPLLGAGWDICSSTKGCESTAPRICALKCAHWATYVMRTTLELPDPLFARLKIKAASERVTLKELLRQYVEQGLDKAAEPTHQQRSAELLPRLEGALAITPSELSNATLFELLEP